MAKKRISVPFNNDLFDKIMIDSEKLGISQGYYIYIIVSSFYNRYEDINFLLNRDSAK